MFIIVASIAEISLLADNAKLDCGPALAPRSHTFYRWGFRPALMVKARTRSSARHGGFMNQKLILRPLGIPRGWIFSAALAMLAAAAFSPAALAQKPAEPATGTPKAARAPGLDATFKTSEGDIVCELFEKEAPITVKNFTDLADGKKEYKDPKTRREEKGPLLRRYGLSPRDSRFYDPGRRSDRNRHGRPGI
jgi:hypothetical protein